MSTSILKLEGTIMNGLRIESSRPTSDLSLDVGNFWHYKKRVTVTFDPAKRQKTLDERGLDFADAVDVFASRHTVERDQRRDYGEDRLISAGFVRGRMVVLVWTPREGSRRVISMRYANVDERERWRQALGGP